MRESYDPLTGRGIVECAVCLSGVALLPLRARAVTPCGHWFHVPCIARAMEVRAECPLCRAPLPPPPLQLDT